MQKLMIAVAVTAVLGVLPASVASAADAEGAHHRARHYARTNGGAYGPYVWDPAVRDGYIMNGAFDWRRIGEHRAWYSHGYNDDCVAWSPDAYHYACDPNNRY